jgi:TDG/mug DNA glycosylase family protein
VPDVIAPNLRVLFCGINPGLYTAATGYHFARPGNRFWPALHAGGFTRRLLTPDEEHELLIDGYGITNVVARATATAAEFVVIVRSSSRCSAWAHIARRSTNRKPRSDSSPQPSGTLASGCCRIRAASTRTINPKI